MGASYEPPAPARARCVRILCLIPGSALLSRYQRARVPGLLCALARGPGALPRVPGWAEADHRTWEHVTGLCGPRGSGRCSCLSRAGGDRRGEQWSRRCRGAFIARRALVSASRAQPAGQVRRGAACPGPVRCSRCAQLVRGRAARGGARGWDPGPRHCGAPRVSLPRAAGRTAG